MSNAAAKCTIQKPPIVERLAFSDSGSAFGFPDNQGPPAVQLFIDGFE
jgi:hypothetical protein